jgi:hypothetical protein
MFINNIASSNTIHWRSIISFIDYKIDTKYTTKYHLPIIVIIYFICRAFWFVYKHIHIPLLLLLYLAKYFDTWDIKLILIQKYLIWMFCSIFWIQSLENLLLWILIAILFSKFVVYWELIHIFLKSDKSLDRG